jgi:phospholipase/carboxylesterase
MNNEETMEHINTQYQQTIDRIAEQLLPFLHTFEAVQEDIHFGREREAQERVRVVAEILFPALTTAIGEIAPPADMQGVHATVTEALSCCVEAYSALLKGSGRNFAEWFLRSRQSLCQALYLLYDIREHLAPLQSYWLTTTAFASLATLETRTPNLGVPVGFLQEPRTDKRREYSLYVPENYSPDRTWPLIVCLHGGYGQGNEYIWTWLRPAKSNGYLLLSPKSAGPTWSVLNPPLDIASIETMMNEVCATYRVDDKRTYLTGLSDGGTFAYLLGLARADRFAGIAPIAGDFHPMLDPLLRQGKGKETPLLVVHGGKDPIFPIESIRQAWTLFQRLGYNVTPHELPEWGHAYPYTINEQIVLPWFASLVKT